VLDGPSATGSDYSIPAVEALSYPINSKCRSSLLFMSMYTRGRTPEVRMISGRKADGFVILTVSPFVPDKRSIGSWDRRTPTRDHK
jgi:hypothetical protein